MNKLTSTSFALGMIVSLALASACNRPEGQPSLCGDAPEGPLNVILVSLDTVRADHLGTYGYERDTSPHLDTLAADSIVFERAIAQSPVTRPSHTSLFQSRLASLTSPLDPETEPKRRVRANRKQAESNPAGFPMLAEVLQAAGWRTAAFTGGGHVSAKLGFDLGFEIYQDYAGGFANSFPPFRQWVTEQASRDEPFFVFLHSYDAHLPYAPPEPYETTFTDPEYQGEIWGTETRELARKVRGRKGYQKLTEEQLDAMVGPADRRHLLDLYDGGLRYTDTWVGELVALLTELDLLEETLVVVLSDHGEELWDHNSLSHGHTLYQELLHVPLILRLPGGCLGGERIRKRVMLMDVAPTVLEILGLPKAPTHQGKSLLPLVLRDGTWPRRPVRPVISEVGTTAAVLRGRYKLLWNHKEKRSTFFDLILDPGEKQPEFNSSSSEARALRQDLSKVRQGLRAVGNDSEAIKDPELIKQLEALGYL